MSGSRQLTKLSAISADIETVASTTAAVAAPALLASSQPQIIDGKRSLGSSESAEQVVTSLQVNSKTKVSPSKKSNPDQPPGVSATPAAAASITGPIAIIPSDSKLLKKSKNSKHVLDPSGSLYYHWSMVVSFAFLYNFWSLSYRFAFREIDADTVALWFALDYSADIIYILDIVINSRTGYLEDGVLQRNVDLTGQHYRESTIFYLDCLCLLPLDILYLSFGYNSILRCTRLVKIYKFWSYVDRTERHTNYPNVFRTFALVHYILVIFHWNACLFHMISKNNIIDIENLYKINDNQCFDILCQYLHAFYWSTLALTTIGDLPRPRTKGEYIYVTVELIFGLFLFASVLGHVANIVTNVSAARKEFQAKLDAVKTFMRMRRVSDELQNKVIRWFDYLWISQQSSDEDKSVACLPDRLKAEIAIHVHLDTLKRVDIFQNTEAGFLCELVLRLKPVLFSPGDYVCRKNEVGHEMYIVSRGILEVVTDEGKTVVATLKAGSYFGEISVLNVGLAGNKRTASVRSVGYSDLFCLNKQDLWDVLKNYPNAEARIRARAEERLSKLDINANQPQQQQQLLQQQQKRRQPGSSNASRLAAQTEGQRSLQEKSRMASRSRRLQASSCACFTSDAKCSHAGPQLRGFGPDSSLSNNNNNNNKSECGCCRLAADPNEGSPASKRPAAAARQCHKSRASLNSGPAAAAVAASAQGRLPPLPPPSSQRHGGPPPGDFYFRNACYDTDDHESRPARRPNHRQTLTANGGDVEAGGGRREPLGYSRSFDQSAPADRVKQCQDSSLDSNDDDDHDDDDGDDDGAASCSSSVAAARRPANQSAADGCLAGRAPPTPPQPHRSRRLAVRRSSSAEPPIDADSWRQLQALRRANGAEGYTCRSSLVDRRRRHGRARRHDEAARAGGLSRQPACHTNSFEEPECTGCKWKRRHQQQQQQHVNSTAGRLDTNDGDGDDYDAPRRFRTTPQLQQQPPTPLSGYWIPVNAGPAGGFIQVPMQLTPAPALTPESQLSLAGSSVANANSSALGGLAGGAGQSAVMTQARAQSVSTMFLNFGGQQHQAALVSPAIAAISSQPSFFGLASQQQQQPITPRQSERRRQEGRDSAAAAAAAEVEVQQHQPDRDEQRPVASPRQGAADAENGAPDELERRRRQKVDDAKKPADEAQTCPDFK